MSTTKRYLVILATALIASALAGTFYYFWHKNRAAFLDAASVRVTVANFGDELGSVSLLAPRADVEKAMDQHYALYIHPDLLAKWKADPRSALGRLTSSPTPDRIDITSTVKNADGTYTILGNIIEVANGSSGKEVVASTPIRFTLAQGGDGWQITGYEKL
jgi:hypothetical protein